VTAPVQYGPRVTAVCAYLWHGQFLSRSRTCEVVSELFGVKVSEAAVASMVKRIAGAAGATLDAICTALKTAPVAHFDETGFRVAGRLAWVHSASAGKFTLITVHPKRGRQGMDAAGVLPAFAGIAVHDCWAPMTDTTSSPRTPCAARTRCARCRPSPTAARKDNGAGPPRQPTRCGT
jgi:transposase